jgi:hypothetical protein
MLRAYVLTGWLRRVMRRRGGWSLVPPVAFVVVAALSVWAIFEAVDAIFDVGGWEPKLTDFANPTTLFLGFLLTVLLRLINRARGRIVVDSFVDYTVEEAKAVSGLATLLVTELGRLRELYLQVPSRGVPAAVGVDHSGFDRWTDAGSFLTVSADDASNVLEGAVASDATIQAGPLRIPLGFVLAAVNRITRGPRVVGTVHLTEAGGGPTLTAQLIGGGSPGGTWRVDQDQEPESEQERKAFLDTMVRELACRMFAQLTLGGRTRWKAVHAFNKYLELYGISYRTPRDRARFLKQAQGKLMEAVAEDEEFELAYYNLGVIYTQLAEAELTSERQSQDATSRAALDRERLNRARQEAARVAFTRAAERNPERWEAYHALAVTLLARAKSAIDIVDDRPTGPEAGELRSVIVHCDQAVELARRHGHSAAAALDLRGMAQTRLADDLAAALRSHREAVAESWLDYCRARGRARADPEREGPAAAAARTNAAGALVNLALAYERRARVGEKSLPDAKLSAAAKTDLETTVRILGWAIEVAGEGSEQAAGCHFERGVVFDRLERHLDAAYEYGQAKQIHPTNCEYSARRAVALARHASVDDAGGYAAAARQEADDALRLLAPAFTAAISPWATPAARKRVTETIKALQKAAKQVRSGDAERMGRLAHLQTELTKHLEPGAQGAIDKVKALLHSVEPQPDAKPWEAPPEQWQVAPEDWEVPQVQMALGRLYAWERRWGEAEARFGALVERLEGKDPPEVIEFATYAEYARAVRECGGDRRAFTRALANAAESVRRDPLNVDARREAGRAHFALAQYTDALAAWKHALWLSPSDPYLHYEVAMCHRQLAGERRDADKRESAMSCATRHFREAQELFDGEDLHGEAWMRVWLGRMALDRGELDEAVRCFSGAQHGSAEAAASLLLGETYLARNQRVAAEHAFVRCHAALRPGSIATLPGRETIDAGWGDELPRPAVNARLAKGLVEARHTTAAPEQDETALKAGLEELERARARLSQIRDEIVRDGVEADLLETLARFLNETGRPHEALVAARRRLRFDASPEALRLERKVRAAARRAPQRPPDDGGGGDDDGGGGGPRGRGPDGGGGGGGGGGSGGAPGPAGSERDKLRAGEPRGRGSGIDWGKHRQKS